MPTTGPSLVGPPLVGLVALGGAAGTLARYAAGVAVGDVLIATVAVNLVGCLAVGLLVGRRPGERARALLGTGFLGGLTTTSAAALQAVQSAPGAACLVGSAVAGVLLCRLGLRLSAPGPAGSPPGDGR